MCLLTDIEAVSQYEPHWLGQDDSGGPTVDQVHHEQGEGGDGREKELVSPAEVEHVVCKPQEYHAAYGEEGTQELRKLCVCVDCFVIIVEKFDNSGEVIL